MSIKHADIRYMYEYAVRCTYEKKERTRTYKMHTFVRSVLSVPTLISNTSFFPFEDSKIHVQVEHVRVRGHEHENVVLRESVQRTFTIRRYTQSRTHTKRKKSTIFMFIRLHV